MLVADVLEQVASGIATETIIEEWNDSITKEAIKEAVELPDVDRAKSRLNLIERTEQS